MVPGTIRRKVLTETNAPQPTPYNCPTGYHGTWEPGDNALGKDERDK